MRKATVNVNFSIVERGVGMELCAEIEGIRFYTNVSLDSEYQADRLLEKLLKDAERQPCKTS